jgi:hypothetical protein
MAQGVLRRVRSSSVLAIMSNSPKLEHNGYTFDFVGKVSSELSCKLCSKVLREPVQVVCCGQHYCKSCIERRIAANPTCPNCHTPNFNHFKDKHFEQRIDMLKIYCPHHKKGCKWTGEMSTVKSHLHASQGCTYEAVLCVNKCGQTMMRRDIKEHLTKHCMLRRVRCQYCNHENTYQVVTGTHYAVCPSYPVKCSYNCNTKNIKRSELNKHEPVCGMKPTTCPFTGAGCKASLVQKDLQDHLGAFTTHHLDLVTKSMDSFKTRADSAERQMHMAKAEVEDLRRQAHSTQSQMERNMRAIARNASELLASCTERQVIAVQSIQALTGNNYTIDSINTPVTLQMVNYSEYKGSGKTWYSTPFYVAGGYKMCLAVHAIGTGSAQGSALSLSVCLLNGEFDDELAWPVELPFHLMVEIVKQDENFDTGHSTIPGSHQNPKTYVYFHSDSPQDRVTSEVLVEARKYENFATHDLVESRLLYYDALMFRVTAESEFL